MSCPCQQVPRRMNAWRTFTLCHVRVKIIENFINYVDFIFFKTPSGNPEVLTLTSYYRQQPPGKITEILLIDG